MVYLKLVSKEARENKEALRADEKFEEKLKVEKFGLEREKINQLREEATERFDHALCAARAAIVTGIVRGDATSAVNDWTISLPHENGVGKMSDLIQIQINNQEEEIRKAARRVAESREAHEAALARKKISLDNIQKFLDIVHSMKILL